MSDPVSSKDVPEWAQNEYREQSQRKLICSKTIEDGKEKIGSVYFGPDVEGAEDLEGGRIRLTHGSGPAEEVESHLERLQFNVDMAKAGRAWQSSGTSLEFASWVAEQLGEGDPDWASKEILSPEDAPKDVNKTISLFEIHVNEGGEVEMLHPSRGTAVKFDTDKQTVAVLRAAIKSIEGVDDPDEANEKFFAFVEHLLPSSEIVGKMRTAQEVRDEG